MSSEHGLTAHNMLLSFPEVLRNDKSLLALATSVAFVLAQRKKEIETLMIYSRIDTLPEPLLDILAYDFKVDWYGYDYAIEAKRAIIKDSFRVHRILGTCGAIDRALSDIYPGSTVDEWADYGGKPFYFRVICDVTNQRVAITNSEIIRTINIYKSRRSHLEDNAVVYRSRCNFGISVKSGDVVYSVRPCGTYPARATQGGITDEDIDIVTGSVGRSYAVPRSGTMDTGRYPVIATQGDIDAGEVDVGADGSGVSYGVRMCGSSPGSII